MASVFVKVLVSDRLPKHLDKPYITDKGLIKSNYFYSQCVEWFMEEIKLPSKEELIKAYLDDKGAINNPALWGANFILNKLKQG